MSTFEHFCALLSTFGIFGALFQLLALPNKKKKNRSRTPELFKFLINSSLLSLLSLAPVRPGRGGATSGGVVKFYRFVWMMGRSCGVVWSRNLDMYGGNHGGVHPEGSVQG